MDDCRKYEKLYAAVKYDTHVDNVKKLLEEGVNANFPSQDTLPPHRLKFNWNSTALHAAACDAYEPRLQKIDLLVNIGGIFTDVIDSGGNTALQLACNARENVYPVVRRLLELKINPNVISTNGWTALCTAASRCSFEVVAELLKYKADVNPPVRDCLCFDVDRDSERSRVDSPPISCAVSRSDEDADRIVRLLVEHDAKLDVPNRYGCTPLCIAASNGKVEMVRLLLELRADPNFPMVYRYPLMECTYPPRGMHLSEEKAVDIARLLLIHGANPNTSKTATQFHGDEFPIHNAVDRGLPMMAQLLLSYGADVNVLEEGHTTLGTAIRRLDLPMVQLLLSYGADINVLHKGHSALELAALVDSEILIDMLLAFDADPNSTPVFQTPLSVCTGKSNATLIRRLLANGADPNVAGDNGDLPLINSVRRRNVGLTRLLLEHDADPNGRSRSGRSALSIAAAFDDIRMAELLLHFNADTHGPSTRDPMCKAARHSNREMVTLLLNHHADVFGVDKTGRTALEIACTRPGLVSQGVPTLLHEVMHEHRTARDIAIAMGGHSRLASGPVWFRSIPAEILPKIASYAHHNRGTIVPPTPSAEVSDVVNDSD